MTIKRILYHQLTFLTLVGLLLPDKSFAQCSTPVFSENFDIPTNTNISLNNSTLPAGETKGDYAASCGGSVSYTNRANCCGGVTNDWRSNTNYITTSPSKDETGWATTGHGSGDMTDFALMVYGSCGLPYGTVWCTNITVAAGDIYDFSAWYTSPWLSPGSTNNPGIWLSINGVQISPTAIVVERTATTSVTNPTPYYQQDCKYTIPAGTSGSVPFCIGMSQTCDNVTYGTCATGGGNDFLVDDIVINKCSAGTTNACTYQGTSLPVTLLNFTAIKTSASTATLQWETSSEKNSSYFSVEKSFDGVHFSEIGMVKAYGNSSSPITYKFNMDFNATSYYRLKIMDFDGSYTYSNIRALEQKDNISSVRIVESRLEISASVNEDTEWSVSIYSLLGQEYYHEKLSLKKGLNSLSKELDFHGSQGAKIIRIIDSQGTEITSQVMIIEQ
jgi:hypothetical protein